MKFERNGFTIAIDTPFGIRADTGEIVVPTLPEGVDGYNYPSDYLRRLAPQERFDQGFIEIVENVTPFDSRYYFAANSPRPLGDCKLARLRELADLRYRKEVGGFELGEVTIATDRETQAVLTAARTLAKENPAYVVNWKAAPGLFLTLDATAIIATANAVAAHVQACFTREMVLSDEIGNATTLDALLAIDITTGWPA